MCWMKMNESLLTTSAVKVTKCASPADSGSVDGSGECVTATNAVTLELLQADSSRSDGQCTAVSLRYPSALDRWFQSWPSASQDWTTRASRPCSRDGPNDPATTGVLARVRRPDDQPPPLDEVRRLAARTSSRLDRCKRDAVEVIRLLGRVHRELRSWPAWARGRPARLHVGDGGRAQAVRAAAADEYHRDGVAASLDEYRDMAAARHRDARDIRSAFGMAVARPHGADGELM